MEFVILGQCWKDQHTEKVECSVSPFRLDVSGPRDAIRVPEGPFCGGRTVVFGEAAALPGVLVLRAA